LWRYPWRVATPLDLHLPDLAALTSLAASYPSVELVVVFGSQVTGTARPDSDVDVGVLGGGFWHQLAVGTTVGKQLNKEPHVVDLGTAGEWLRFQVARDGVLLYQRTSDAWVEFKAKAMIAYWDVAPLIALTTEGVRRQLRLEAERAICE
jgi:predicted nucleotidyltransferase